MARWIASFLAIKAITAVKNTVAPIPAYLFCSPLEQEFTMSLSTPEHRRKKRFNMMIDLIDDDYTNITPKVAV
jgi:hypothetical protein